MGRVATDSRLPQYGDGCSDESEELMEITLSFKVKVNEEKIAEKAEADFNAPTAIEAFIAEAISAWEYEGIVDSVIEAEGEEV